MGKLKLNTPLADIVDTQLRTNNIEILNIPLEHIYALEELPDHHRDPFDRLIISQALVEDTVLISSDPVLSKYPVRVSW